MRCAKSDRADGYSWIEPHSQHQDDDQPRDQATPGPSSGTSAVFICSFSINVLSCCLASVSYRLSDCISRRSPASNLGRLRYRRRQPASSPDSHFPTYCPLHLLGIYIPPLAFQITDWAVVCVLAVVVNLPKLKVSFHLVYSLLLTPVSLLRSSSCRRCSPLIHWRSVTTQPLYSRSI